MNWIHLKDFTADFLLEGIKKGIESEAFKKQLEELVKQWKKEYQPGDIFHITPHFKLPDFQVLPDLDD